MGGMTKKVKGKYKAALPIKAGKKVYTSIWNTCTRKSKVMTESPTSRREEERSTTLQDIRTGDTPLLLCVRLKKAFGDLAQVREGGRRGRFGTDVL